MLKSRKSKWTLGDLTLGAESSPVAMTVTRPVCDEERMWCELVEQQEQIGLLLTLARREAEDGTGERQESQRRDHT